MKRSDRYGFGELRHVGGAILILTAFTLSTSANAADPPTSIPKGFALQWEADFADKNVLEQFEFTDPGAWRLNPDRGRPALELSRNSHYNYPIRSPRSIALLATRKFEDFVLEAELLQTGKEYGHRDLCLFFGFQDPGHYYYAHFATKTDPEANQVFIVNEKPFTKITKQTNEGSKWGEDQWHRVRVQRIGSAITVWFDDMEKPAMLADDDSFGAGLLGFGSYNDTGLFAKVRVWAPMAGKVARSGTIFAEKEKPAGE